MNILEVLATNNDNVLEEATFSLDDITNLHFNALKRVANNTLDLDTVSDKVIDILGDLEAWNLIQDDSVTETGQEVIQTLNAVGTKQSSVAQARNRNRPKKKIGATDINLRTGNKFLDGGRNQKPGGGTRMKSKRAKDVRSLFGFDQE